MQASTAWGFELCAARSRQTETVFAVTPWPIPFAHVEDEILRYTLVSVGRDGRAADVFSGPFRRTSASWRSSAPIQRALNLLAVPALRDAYLARTWLAGVEPHLAGEATHALQCRRGEQIVLTLQVGVGGSPWRPALADWRFETSPDLPERLARRALVLIDDGRWMADPE